MKQLIKIWDELEKWIAGGFALAATLAGFYAVVVRQFNMPVSWSEEVIIYLIAWGIFLGVSSAARDGQHVSFDMLKEILKGKGRVVINFVIVFLALAFCIAVTVTGSMLVADFKAKAQVSQSSLRFPLWLAILSVPVGFGLTSLRYINKLVSLTREAAGRKSGKGA
jgi:C4-dicarboxylate transporter DctQ subunit